MKKKQWKPKKALLDFAFLIIKWSQEKPVADLGGAVGGNCPPLMMKTELWRPIFGKKGAPYPDPKAFFSSCFVMNVGNI